MSLTVGSLRVLAQEHADLDRIPLSLLTTGTANPKTGKGEKQGFRTAVMHLTPGNIAGAGEMCAGRTLGCFNACLNHAGRSAFDISNHVARMRRTRYFKRDRAGFGLKLERECEAHLRAAARQGLTPVVRLNGTSDLPWENVRFEWADGTVSTVFERFPHVQFYDYTKVIGRLRKQLPPNYDLTFSLADGNEDDAAEAIRLGFRVAVVLRNTANPGAKKWNLPSEWNGVPVVDADKTDLRFLEPAGVYCGLRAKGLAKTDTTGFVHNV